jgi:hypothetical protein
MQLMSPQRERWIMTGIALLFLALQVVPVVAGFVSVDSDHVFGGFLLNPHDSSSYLAKMRQGYDGAWQFTLPYTAEPGQPTAINLYYLFLGHVARWTSLPMIAMFHGARLGGAILLCFVLYRFLGAFFADAEQRLMVFSLALFGSGLGWLAAAFGGFTADFWWAEAYPFLTAYVNPHFVFGLALQLWLLTPLREAEQADWRKIAVWAAAALTLAIVYPFGWMATVAILIGWSVVQALQVSLSRAQLLRTGALFAAGAPYAVYAYYTVQTHPVLSLWDAQNLTPTPVIWDVLVAFSPAILLAVIGGILVARRRSRTYQVLIVWVLLIAVAMYAPVNLQRRLATGLYIPVAALAVIAIYMLSQRTSIRRLAFFAILLFSLPTNAIVVAGGIASVRNGDPLLTMHGAEADGFHWLDANAPHGSLVLAAPQTGLFMPGYASVRVLFGHWFETVHAQERRDEIVAFFEVMSPAEAMQYLDEMGVDFIFYGPRERSLGEMPQLAGWALAHETENFQIWSKE